MEQVPFLSGASLGMLEPTSEIDVPGWLALDITSVLPVFRPVAEAVGQGDLLDECLALLSPIDIGKHLSEKPISSKEADIVQVEASHWKISKQKCV